MHVFPAVISCDFLAGWQAQAVPHQPVPFVGAPLENDEGGPRKNRFEMIAEQQALRNVGRGRGGGRKAKEEVDPMDPVSHDAA